MPPFGVLLQSRQASSQTSRGLGVAIGSVHPRSLGHIAILFQSPKSASSVAQADDGHLSRYLNDHSPHLCLLDVRGRRNHMFKLLAVLDAPYLDHLTLVYWGERNSTSLWIPIQTFLREIPLMCICVQMHPSKCSSCLIHGLLLRRGLRSHHLCHQLHIQSLGFWPCAASAAVGKSFWISLLLGCMKVQVLAQPAALWPTHVSSWIVGLKTSSLMMVHHAHNRLP